MLENEEKDEMPEISTPEISLETQEAAAEPEQSETAAEEKWPEEPMTAKSTPRDRPEIEEGEYQYKNGYTQRIYADAHYAPADEGAVPPRYYAPPTRPVRTREKKSGGKGGAWKVACLCLACAMFGVAGGAALTGMRLSARLNALESRETPPAVVIGADSSTTGKTAAAVIEQKKPLAQIYDMACRQVVGVTTEVTVQSFFGQTSSAVSGSGFIISEDGYILTNYHVIEYADKGGSPVTVMMNDGTEYEAAIVGSEESNDVAVLKIEATGLTPAALGNSDLIAVGDEVHAVGNPLGELDFSMTNGHVSALDRTIATENAEDEINMFQIDAAVNRGNSGGPVYNASGEVIGIVTAKYSSTGVEGIGFAIPINDAVRIAQDLITKGYVTGKAYLGVSIETQYNAMYAQYYNMPLGAYIHSVESDSCAERAGLQAGDIITRVGETEIESYADLKQALKTFSAGDEAELEIYRADKSLTIRLVFDEARPSH